MQRWRVTYRLTRREDRGDFFTTTQADTVEAAWEQVATSLGSAGRVIRVQRDQSLDPDNCLMK